MNYTVKQTNGDIFYYTNIYEAIDGFADNFNTSFSSELIEVNSENEDLVLVSYNKSVDDYSYHPAFKDYKELFMCKMETRLESLFLSF